MTSAIDLAARRSREAWERGGKPRTKNKRCAQRTNLKLIFFLEELLEDANTRGMSFENNWFRCLQKAKDGMFQVAIPICSAEGSRIVQGVGPSLARVFARYFVLYPHSEDNPVPESATEVLDNLTDKGRGKKGRKCEACPGEVDLSFSDACDGDHAKSAPKKAKRSKLYEPGYKTANFALLVCLDKAEREGIFEMDKQTLIQMAERSKLASGGMQASHRNLFQNQPSTRYDGWSNFNKYLKKVAPGHEKPWVSTRSNPMKISLTDEGRGVASRLHGLAELRGDCKCGLIAPDNAGETPLTVPPLPLAMKNSSIMDMEASLTQSVGKSERACQAYAVETLGQAPQGSGCERCTKLPTVLSSSSEESMQSQHVQTEPTRSIFFCGETAIPKGRLQAMDDPDMVSYLASMWKSPEAMNLLGLGVTSRHLRMPPIGLGERFSDVYEIVLVLDNREQFSRRLTKHHNSKRAASEEALKVLRSAVERTTEGCSVACEVDARTLAVGDALWLARRKFGVREEFVLDLLVERKSLEDLLASVADGRYRKQKYVLLRSGLRCPVYLCEGSYEDPAANLTESQRKAIRSALLTTELRDGFQVLKTEGVKQTFELYANLTKAIAEKLITLASNNTATACDSLPTFYDFSKMIGDRKKDEHRVRTVFGMMLSQVHGVSGDLAKTIVSQFPTPAALIAAYKMCENVKAAQLMLSHVRASEQSPRGLGDVGSSRIYTLLFGGSTHLENE
mmetsp:Transcript_13841/g.26572  ORF Transcript_13841/g.26572 Transcript_13841/m.26572 type:complete len:735 (+) Transcript_13841:110-2314(+)|eukprot:CAMPEP_0114233596 /NCGR_PEP_ID=MMETSP0058-20121206/5252_1 /TAXON_ID=36894 /ORGANISM="Pyramimonas parkeae, CCMP726" /LENGTH=734 /DNA_ID=CAMNT_0001345203 /DNA_START=42 /DNA_END=2246 /DNA_ORIENTATION=+